MAPSGVPKFISKLAGQRVLILGGSSGLGFTTAEAAIENGASVTIASSNPQKLEKALHRLRTTYKSFLQSGQTITGQVCDLSNQQTLERNLHDLLRVAAGDSKIDHITITAAPMLWPPPLNETKVEEVESHGFVRLVAPVMIAKLIPQYMHMTHKSSFTMTSGSHTVKPDPGWALHAAYCGAVEALMRALAVDLKPLRVNVVSPGAVLTEGVIEILGDAYEREVERCRRNSTLGVCGKPEDLAEGYVYLMKDQYVTGTIIESNGGMLLA
ncbi:hypothetical protein ZTR_05887 [Talaromyces verruculosus]|nr:hypothetical protein ZTR_05887 [Talaromyces verruculosus]